VAAAPPAKPPALQAVAKISDVEGPPKVDIAEVEVSADILALERANSLPNLVDETTSDTFPGLDEAPTAKPRVVDLSKLPPATSPSEDDEDEEENAEEPTLLRPSPLEQMEPMEQSFSEEPTLLRASPLEQKESPLSSSDEPTLLRRSPLEQEEEEAQTTRPAGDGTKPSEEATDRKLRVALSPEVLAQAEAELSGPAATSPKPAVSPKPPIREAMPDSVEAAPNLVRTQRPRSAGLWGLALAAVASVAALIVVAIGTDWPSRLRGTTQPPTATPTAAVSDVPEPQITALPTTTAVTGIDAGAPIEDAGLGDAAAEAGAVALAGDAGADAGAGAGADAGADAGTAAPISPTAPAGAPPGDPMSLPEKKGYLVVTTPSPVHVYVQGAQAGMANESLVVDCGPKFVRLGDPPAVAPAPGAGAGAVRWRSEGRSVVVACRSVTSVAITPTP
jgi:hypothetical protein